MTRGGYRHITVRRYRSGVCAIQLFPQPLGVLLNLISAHARPLLVLSGTEFAAPDLGARANANLAGLARAQGVPLHYADATGACIVVGREDLGRLLAGVLHWNMHCWDTRRAPSPADLARQVARFAAATQPILSYPRLHLLDGAGVLIDSHDDTSLAVHAYGPALPRAVLARALTALATAVHADFPSAWKQEAAIAEVPAEFVDYYWETLPAFTVVAEAVPAKPGRIRLCFGTVEAGGGHAEPRGHLDYDTRARGWRQRYR